MKHHPKWKETHIGGTHFPLPWLREEGVEHTLSDQVPIIFSELCFWFQFCGLNWVEFGAAKTQVEMDIVW